ncbi:MAG: pyridoxamine 5'-phosphate oxidase family protein [Lactobacillales bacterium]|jgi:general stress protein 26|nr:pyridoxamine 5'-phosphate oxidase family protein [Lactobacillales bacterium]
MEYSEAIAKIEKLLEATKFAVLATANKQGVVSASQMCLINDGLSVYFQTDKTFEKIKNITENPNIALNLGAYYFKGTAKIIGHPTDFPAFIEKIKKKHLKTYENYTNLPNEVLIQVDLTECKIWGADASKDLHAQETIQVLDLKEKTSRVIVCDKI